MAQALSKHSQEAELASAGTLALLPAVAADLPAVAALMNASFRGPATQRAWTGEGGYLNGERSNVPLLREEIAAGARYFIVRDAPTTPITGCVRLQPVSAALWHLGSLAVDPALQSAGLGRKLLHASELYATEHGARILELTVINIRETLISWYERRGYSRTGEMRPFPYGDNRYGTPTRQDLAFVVLRKKLQE